MLSTFGIPMDELAQQRFEACEGEGHHIERVEGDGDKEVNRRCYGVCRVCNAEFEGTEMISGGDEFGNAEYSVDPNSWELIR
jgi:hypothetical protein